MSERKILQPLEFARYLRSAREKLELTQEDIVDQAFRKASRNTVKKLERLALAKEEVENGNTRKVRETTLQVLAPIYGLTLQEVSDKIEALNLAAPKTETCDAPGKEIQSTFYHRNWFILAVCAGILALFGLGLFNHYTSSSVESQILASTSLDGKTLQIQDLESGILKPIGFSTQLLKIIHLIKGGEHAIIATVELDKQITAQAGIIYGYDKNGAEKWQLNSYSDNTQVGTILNDTNGYFFVSYMDTAVFFDRSPQPYIWAIAREQTFANSRLIIVDPWTGEIVYSLWIPGRGEIPPIVADLDGDGFAEIVVPTYNNDLTELFLSERERDKWKFNFGTVMYIDPIMGEEEAAPNMRFPEISQAQKSVRWTAITHPASRLAEISSAYLSTGAAVRMQGHHSLIIHTVDYKGNLVGSITTDGWYALYGKTATPPPLFFVKRVNANWSLIPTVEIDADTLTSSLQKFQYGEFRSEVLTWFQTWLGS